jgi:hypothetical protein
MSPLWLQKLRDCSNISGKSVEFWYKLLQLMEGKEKPHTVESKIKQANNMVLRHFYSELTYGSDLGNVKFWIFFV